MRILFDLQALQNGSRSRGIGRYVRNFFAELGSRAGVELVALINSSFTDTLNSVRADVGRIVGKENVLVWKGLTESAEKFPKNTERARLNRFLYEDFIESLDFDLLLVGSVFDGFMDDTTVSLSGRGKYLRAAIHYDLIPKLNPDQFFWDEDYVRFYEDRLEQLSRADILFAISRASALEADENLTPGSRRIIPIGAAIDQTLFNSDSPFDEEILENHGIIKPFVMHLSALEPRKNFDALIRAFAKMPKKVRDKHQLVFVGSVHPQYASFLKAEATKANLQENQLRILSGLDDQLVAQLYRQAALFCFPSLHEGFGLPPLEAMASGCPTIGSNVSSIPEVIGDSTQLFDPTDESAIAQLMQRLLTDREEAERVAQVGKMRAATFTWSAVCDRFIDALSVEPTDQTIMPPPSLAKSIARFQRTQDAPPEAEEAAAFARNLVENSDLAMKWRGRPAARSEAWRIEGPFDSSYSLALLNRETARSLDEKGFDVALRSMNEPGNSSVDSQYLSEHHDLKALHDRFLQMGETANAIVSRNNYPPIVEDLVGRVRAMHHYAWEESGFPAKWVDAFNDKLTVMTCLSEHVRKIMIDNGVSVPMLTSGCGVDHWERITPDDTYKVEGRGFKFLHVSSCFPRKGAESLVEAFGMAFSARDDVTLVIKTFHNPHNDIEKILGTLRAQHSDFPDVITIFDDLTDAQLKALYAQCDVMVGPSFAEGYGLPLAEALLSGIPVITTAWGGQLDFCNDGNSWLLDYKFERAQSHFNLWASAWAKVEVGDLIKAMKQAHALPAEERAAMAARGRRQLLAEHKWSDVTDRLSVAAQVLPKLDHSPVRIGWITTWNSKCGIATYSSHLIKEMRSEVKVFAPANEATVEKNDEAIRLWRLSKDNSFLEDILNSSQVDELDVFVIQFNYGFYNHNNLGDFIHKARRLGKRVVMFLHATHHPGDQFAPGAENFHLRHMIPALRECDRLLVHSIDDLNRLKALGVIDNVALFPHGVLTFPNNEQTIIPKVSAKRKIVGTYGFALPHKGLINIVKAIHSLRQAGHDVGLTMTNAQYPAKASANIVAELKELIVGLDLQDVVDFNSEFLSDDESMTRLQATDLIVFPYEDTEESASGAVRYGMAMRKPVLVSRNPIFNDLSGATFECDATSIESLADGIRDTLEKISFKSDEAAQIHARAESWRKEHAYENLGRRLTGMCQSLVHQY